MGVCIKCINYTSERGLCHLLSIHSTSTDHHKLLAHWEKDDFILKGLKYTLQANAYMFLMSDEYPKY